MPRDHHLHGPDDAERVSVPGSSLVMRGGKVDAEALLEALETAGEDADDEGLRTVRFDLKHDLDKRLDKYLCDRITFMSRNQLQRLIDEGGVTVNGRKPKASTKLNAGDAVEVVIPPPPPKGTQPEDIPLDVMYEDEHLIVINKAPDIIVHPARSHLKGTMINALAFHFRNRSASGGGLSGVGAEFARPGVVHRLDRDTTGVIVFAKSDEAHWKLGHQFEHRRVDKRYMALVHGHMEPDADVIDLPLGPHPSREKGYREKYVVRHDELGKPSVTIYRVRERYALTPRAADVVAPAAPVPVPGWSAAPTPQAARRSVSASQRAFTLVELELKTGRTHQIRVHLSHNDWPIVGDDMYGGKPLADAAGVTLIDRQALHATVLSFTHPITNVPMSFTAPLRGDLAAAVGYLRTHGHPETLFPPGATVDLGKVMPG